MLPVWGMAAILEMSTPAGNIRQTKAMLGQ